MVASYRWGNRNMPAKHLTSVYGNGWQAVLSVYGNGCATPSYCLCNCVLLFGQLCLTACATPSYSSCNCVLRLMELASSSLRLWKWLCNCVLQLVQPRLTACATASYGLWKWLASSSSIYGNGFRSGTSENQRLHKKLGNSENRVTYRLR
jgi:hypothetical protein